MWRRVCLVHGFGDGDKEGREREWNKQHQHCLANLKDASRGEQPYSAILREDAGLSSPPTDSSSSRPRDISKIFLYRRHFKISYIILTCSSLCYQNSYLHRSQLAAQRKIPHFPNHQPRLAPSSPLRSQLGRRHPINSNLLRPRQIMVHRRSRKFQHQSVQYTHWGPG